MNRRWRSLLLPAGLLALWLLVNGSLAVSDWLLGLVFALAVTALTNRARPLHAAPRRLGLMLALCGRVLVDIVRANIAAGRIILAAGKRPPRSAFLDIPLDLVDPHGLAMLIVIVTATPGTVWIRYRTESRVLTLHILDLDDAAAIRRTIKERYERPLMEIFA